MAEAGNATGNRNDLSLDASRCLKMRFDESGCRRCVDICPQKAISLDGFLAINPNHCRGCLLCTTVCPSGALEQKSDFSACIAQLSRVREPVLGCLLTKENSNAALACLGGLSEEHLVAIHHSLSGKLTLNQTLCNGCPNSAMIAILRQRLTELSGKGLLADGGDIVIAGSAADICHQSESLDRRSFFKSLRSSLFQSAAAILSTTTEQGESRTEYAGKRAPARRELLNRTAASLSPEVGNRLLAGFNHLITFSDGCTACQGCAAICPTGALRSETSDDQPVFCSGLCTGCGLCEEFCLDGALTVSRV